jgi:RND family efflux transporter MFP subunit
VQQARVLQASATADAAAAALAEAELRLARTQVRAPIAGVVLRRVAAPGTQLMAGADPDGMHVLHLYDPTKLQARIDVPLADTARVGVGQAVEVTVEALPQRRFAAEVVRLVQEADVAKNTVEVKVLLRETAPELRADMLVRARFLAAASGEGDARHELVAPTRALLEHADGAIAFVYRGELGGTGRVERRSLRLGQPVGDDGVAVQEGLRPGERVVLDPGEGLEDGARVRDAGEGH